MGTCISDPQIRRQILDNDAGYLDGESVRSIVVVDLIGLSNYSIECGGIEGTRDILILLPR